MNINILECLKINLKKKKQNTVHVMNSDAGVWPAPDQPVAGRTAPAVVAGRRPTLHSCKGPAAPRALRCPGSNAWASGRATVALPGPRLEAQPKSWAGSK